MNQQGFWASVYAFFESMEQSGSWLIYAVIGVLVVGLCGWGVYWWGKFKRSAGL